jgi:hypothetical protein
MQFYKYQAALLLESRGGEGGEAIPDVSVRTSLMFLNFDDFLFFPSFRFLLLLPFQFFPPQLILLLTTILFSIPTPPFQSLSLPFLCLFQFLFTVSSFSYSCYLYCFLVLFLFLFLFLFLLVIPIPSLYYFCISYFLGCAGNFGRNRNTYGSPGCSSICPCYSPSPSVSASVSAGHSARTHDDTAYHR